MNRTKFVLLITAMMGTVAGGFVLAPSNIDPAHKFSWDENSGWMNWLDGGGGASGVVVLSDHLSGYIWSENNGWINVGNGGGPYANTDNTNYGVNILGDTDLDGFAWDENSGWINFGWGAAGDLAGRAQFDGTRFRGYAWGENDGWINLDDSVHFVAVVPPSCLAPVVIADICSRYIEIAPDPSETDPVAFRVECNGVIEWVELIQSDYDDVPGGNTQVNVGKGQSACDNAYFLKPDTWTSSGANSLVVTGLSVPPGSRPTVYAVVGDCITPTDSDPAQPATATWAYCDSSGDGMVTIFADLFKQFRNTTAGGGGEGFTGPDPGVEVDTQGNAPTVPDQNITVFADIFSCFLATAAGGGDTWSGETCP